MYQQHEYLATVHKLGWQRNNFRTTYSSAERFTEKLLQLNSLGFSIVRHGTDIWVIHIIYYNQANLNRLYTNRTATRMSENAVNELLSTLSDVFSRREITMLVWRDRSKTFDVFQK